MLQMTSSIVFPPKPSADFMLGLSRQSSLMESPLFDGKAFLDSQAGSFLPLGVLQSPQTELSISEGTSDVQQGGKSKKARQNKGQSSNAQALKDKRESDSFLAELQRVHKKVKTQDTVSNSSTQYDEASEEHFSSQGSVSLKSNSTSEIESVNKMKPTAGSKKIVQMCFDEISEGYVYKVEAEANSSSSKLLLLTREEVIKEDPKILLYFYENHIQFSQTAHFQAEKLKKL